jgi:4-hydroxyphenylpyruvate dioxygenase
LEQNEGPGLQHLALKTDDIFTTIEHMRRAEEELGGFELMKSPSDEYYRELPERLGDQLTVRSIVIYETHIISGQEIVV